MAGDLNFQISHFEYLFKFDYSNPLQCSCLENPRDGGPWWAAVYGVAQSRTRLKRLSSSSSSRHRKQTCGCQGEGGGTGWISIFLNWKKLLYFEKANSIGLMNCTFHPWFSFDIQLCVGISYVSATLLCYHNILICSFFVSAFSIMFRNCHP